MKTIKILAVFILTLGLFSLYSCKKEKKIVPANTITANVDGTATPFNKNVIAINASLLGVTVTDIQGVSAAGDTISISLMGTLTAGKTYAAVAGGGSEEEPSLTLTTKTDEFSNDDNSTNNLVRVTINSISATVIEGTFTGDLISDNIVGNNLPAKKSLTSGKFSVAF